MGRPKAVSRLHCARAISRTKKLKVWASGSAILQKWRKFTTRPSSSTDGTKSTARKFSSSQILAWVCGPRAKSSNNHSQLKGFEIVRAWSQPTALDSCNKSGQSCRLAVKLPLQVRYDLR